MLKLNISTTRASYIRSVDTAAFTNHILESQHLKINAWLKHNHQYENMIAVKYEIEDNYIQLENRVRICMQVMKGPWYVQPCIIKDPLLLVG